MVFLGKEYELPDSLLIRTISCDDAELLAKAASFPKIWQLDNVNLSNPSFFIDNWFAKAIQQMNAGDRLPFVIELAGKIVGSTSYYAIDFQNKAVNIGYTWLSPCVWGGFVNMASKYVLLSNLFEMMKFERACFSIDIKNTRAAEYLEKIGAYREGVLRRNILQKNQTFRDSAIYSIIQDEWVKIKDMIKCEMNKKISI